MSLGSRIVSTSSPSDSEGVSLVKTACWYARRVAFANLRRSARDGRAGSNGMVSSPEIGVPTIKSEIVCCRVGVVLGCDELLSLGVHEMELGDGVVVEDTPSATLARGACADRENESSACPQQHLWLQCRP